MHLHGKINIESHNFALMVIPMGISKKTIAAVLVQHGMVEDLMKKETELKLGKSSDNLLVSQKQLIKNF